jgi:serine/threonine protein phosphatase PrpC
MKKNMEKPDNDNIEKSEVKRLESGTVNIPEDTSIDSADYIESLGRGVVACDGVNGEKKPRVAAIAACRTAQAFEKQLVELNGASNERFREKFEEIIAAASARIAVKTESADSATTADICWVDGKRVLHVAHRSDGLVVRISKDFQSTELVTPPHRLATALNDIVRGYVSSLGTLKEWGVPEYRSYEDLMGTIKWARDNDQLGELIKIIEGSQFPTKLEIDGKMIDTRLKIAQTLYEHEGKDLGFSEPTQCYHVDCEEGDIVIAMTDGVLDNLACFAIANHLMEKGIDEEEASWIAATYYGPDAYRGERRIKGRLKEALNDIYKDEVRAKQAYDDCIKYFKSLEAIYNDVVRIVRNEVSYAAEKMGGKINPQTLAAHLVTQFRNQYKKDDAACGVVIVD